MTPENPTTPNFKNFTINGLKFIIKIKLNNWRPKDAIFFSFFHTRHSWHQSGSSKIIIGTFHGLPILSYIRWVIFAICKMQYKFGLF
jgi:hypothetical protein